MTEPTRELICDWTAVHDALEGIETSVKVYGACTCQSPGYTLRLERIGDSTDDSPHLELQLVVTMPADDMPALLTPCGVEFEERRTAIVERVTISGAVDVSIDVMHPRDV